ncbi:scavenger receptor cysteine-rich type 1 protein M130-like [Scyliorhinus torazame]|uniref:scavenger receptor cysteine-rich type 1 protein M130-like n=1 Tax=Scyliorhinus torazame TaxID=75743 RepID=UPI003B59E960
MDIYKLRGSVFKSETGQHGPRLVGGQDRCSGRDEVLHGDRWGTLCDVYFGLEAASMIYEHLQCGAVKNIMRGAPFGKGTGPVWKENYRCGGSESRLWQCPLSSVFDFSCSHGNEANVICSGHKQLRLSDGASRCAGRLEIYYSGTWGSVCDDSWDLTDAEVVCKQLGCGNALQLPFPAPSGPGTGTIWLDELDCSGNESSIWQCPHALWGKHDCNHKEDVEIMCSEHKEIRLVNGKHRCEGSVEVFYNGTWGTVCSDKLENRDADVICKQLECGTADFIDYDAKSFGMGTGHIWLDEIECLSHETTLWQCQGDPWGEHNCEHREDAGIVCSGQILRLAGGDTKCSGRVAILCNNTWGTVCDESWDMNDARVVCRQMDFSPPLLATGGAAFGQDSATINTLNQIEYYSSHSLGDTDPGSAYPEDECSNMQGMSKFTFHHLVSDLHSVISEIPKQINY